MAKIEPLTTFDPSVDFDAESPTRDADTYSDTLRLHHQLLWSKKTPSGEILDLQIPGAIRSAYLTHSHEGEVVFWFGSDAITNSYSRWVRPKRLVEAISSLSQAQRELYLHPTYTIGSSLIWPLRTKDGSINTARARGKMADRMDLTLDCVRQLYLGRTDNPLGPILNRYSDYFDLFETFAGFVEFFHLQDLVDENLDQVRFWIANDDFRRHGLPESVDEYVQLREATIDFIARREARMVDWVVQNTTTPIARR